MDKNIVNEIWLAGGCFWGVESYFSMIDGVISTDVGYANGKTKMTKYIFIGVTGHAETVHVVYNPNIVSLETLLNYYFKVVDPTIKNRQGNDIGHQYRTGIYYKDEDDLSIIKKVIENEQLKYKSSIVTEILPLNNYSPAEKYHQKYLEKHPNGYCHIDLSILKQNSKLYVRPTEEEIKRSLCDTQYKVTQQNGTEKPFNNEYWDKHEKGIYVDVVTGEPLFVSSDKFESGCGWPSFTKPIERDTLITQEDKTNNMQRIEVRSAIGNSHLGHMFEDGPKESGGLRYCINSAALKFIPIDEMANAGYAEFERLIK